MSFAHRIKLIVLGLLLFPAALFAQTSTTGRIDEGPLAARPTVCTPGDYYVTTDTNPVVEYKCSTGNIWNQESGGGGGGAPGGVNGDTQCKNGAIFVACSQNAVILYASPNGNDTNSGKTWDTAKLTIMAAVCALPTGNCSASPKQAGIGTVYFQDTTVCNSNANAGCWIAGFGDSQYPNMTGATGGPTAWTIEGNPGGSLNFICATMSNGISTSNRPTCQVNGPTHSVGNGNLPLLWVSGNSLGTFYISGMSDTDGVSYASQWGRIGIDSATGVVTGTPTVTQTVSFTVENSASDLTGGAAGAGPALTLGNGFWMHFHDDTFGGNQGESCQISSISRTSGVTTVTTSNCNGSPSNPCPFLNGDHLSISSTTGDGTFNGTFTAASACGAGHTVTFNQAGPNFSGSVGSAGLIADDRAFSIVCFSCQVEMSRMHLNGQGMKFYSGTSSNLQLNDVYMEGDATFTEPILWISPLIYGNGGQVDISGLWLSDIPTLPAIINDANSLSGIGLTYGGPNVVMKSYQSQSTSTVGSGILLNGNESSTRATGLIASGQSGWYTNTKLEADTDIARREAPMASNIFTNLTPQNPTSWVLTSATTASGKTDPFGGSGAIEIDATAGGASAYVYFVNQTPNVGDTWYFGAWVRAVNGFFQTGGAPFTFFLGSGNLCYNGTTTSTPFTPFPGDGNWFWVIGSCKVLQGTTAVNVALGIDISTAAPAQIYRPFVFRIPAATTLSATEIATEINSLGFGPSTQAGAGDIAFPADKKICLPSGSATNEFCAYFTHSNTANRSYTLPDQSGGTVALETAPSNIAGQLLTAQNAAPANFLSPGISDGNGGSSITTTPYTIQCDSTTGLIDRAKLLRFQFGASVITVPQSTVTGCLGGFVVSVVNDGAGTLTFNRTGTDTFSIFTGGTFFSGSTSLDNQTSFSLTNGQYATLNQGATSIWEVRISSNPFPNGNVISANNPPQNVSAVPMVPGTQIFGCTVTSTSNQISNCPLPVPTAAAVGWLVHITNGCCGALNQVGSVYLLPLNGSTENIITGSCGANCFTVSQNATGSASGFGAGSAVVTVGPDSTAAATNITNYLNGSTVSGQQCPSVFFGSGIYMVKSAEFNITGAGCLFPLEGGSTPGVRTGLDTQAAFVGYQAMAGMLAPTQDFNFTTCTGGVSGKACFFSGNGIRIQNTGINGGAASLTGGNHNNIIMELDNDSALYMVVCQGWGASDTSLIGVQQGQGAQAIVATQIDACGQTGLNITDTLPAVVSSSFSGDNSITNLNVAAGGLLFSNNNGFAGVPNSKYDVTIAATGVWVSSGDNFESYAGITSPAGVNVNGTAKLTGDYCNETGTTPTCIVVESGGFLYIGNSVLQVPSGGNTVAIFSGGTMLDLGGNNFSAFVNKNFAAGVAPSFSGYQSIEGTCTGTATASSTLGLYGTGPNVTATTCTSTTTGTGVPMNRSGILTGLYVTAAHAGVSASSGVVTVYKNGVATTITCTVGTGTSCSDPADTASFVTGDLITIKFTTQAAEVLAGVNAVIGWQ